MNIRSLNNASTLVSTDSYSILIDPWLVGNLYKGAWSPYARVRDLHFLKSLTAVFISHLHEDHWDIETLTLIDKNVAIFIPKMKVNRVIENRLRGLGFTNITFVDLSSTTHVSEDFSLRINHFAPKSWIFCYFPRLCSFMPLEPPFVRFKS